MSNNTVIDFAARIINILSSAKTHEVDLETLLSWIGWDPKAAGWDGDVKISRALNLTCDKHVRDGVVTYSLKPEHRDV